MADETKAYRVSLSADGSEALTVRVPLRLPHSKTVRRHFEVARELPDGTKRMEFERRDVESEIDVEAEMRADAVRAWNASRASAVAARSLTIEHVPDVEPVAEATAPRGRFGRKPAQVEETAGV